MGDSIFRLLKLDSFEQSGNIIIMKIDHICGGHVYLISNYGVARNPIFCDQSDIDFFRSNVEKYLSKICDIHAYDFKHNQFQILLSVKWRNCIEKFFIEKYSNSKNENFKQLIINRNKNRLGVELPYTYEIFSQEVSNMLNSYAKYFNFKYRRKGGLFGSRYTKILVESESEMLEWVARLNNRQPLVFFEKDWQTEEICPVSNEAGECSSKVLYEEEKNGSKNVKGNFCTIFSNFCHYFRQDLRGCFNSLPPSNIKKQNFAFFILNFIKINGYFPPW